MLFPPHIRVEHSPQKFGGIIVLLWLDNSSVYTGEVLYPAAAWTCRMYDGDQQYPFVIVCMLDKSFDSLGMEWPSCV